MRSACSQTASKQDDTPLPPEAIASIVASGDEDAAWIEELRLRATSDDDVSLEHPQRIVRGGCAPSRAA